MRKGNTAYFYRDAAIPFLVTRGLSLIVSIFLYWCLVEACQVLLGSQAAKPVRIAAPLLIVAALEYCLTRSNDAGIGLDARLYLRLSWLTQFPRYWAARFGRKLIHVVFLTTSIWAAFEIASHVLAGWSESSAATVQGHDLATAGLSLALGILAIFSTVVGLVIQSTMQDYSPSFIWVIKRNKIYIAFTVLALGISVLDLLLLNRSIVPELERASLFGSIYCIASLPFLIYETFYFMDISNVVRKIAQDAVSHANSRIREQGPIMSGALSADPAPIIPVRTQWRMFFEKWVVGTMRTDAALPKFEVSGEILSALEEKIRPITSICLKAIASDRREAALSCLHSLSYVTSNYIRARNSYEGSPDRFLLFIEGQAEAIFNSALSSPNQQYASDVADAVAALASSCLQLTKARGGGYPENPHAGVFTGLLAKIAVRSFHLQHTDSPMKACRAIGRVGRLLLGSEAYVPVLFGISRDITSIGLFCSMQRGPWAAALTQATAGEFVSLLHTSLQQASKTGHRYDTACRVLLENLEAVVSSWYEREKSHPDNQSVIAPIVGSLWLGTTVPRLFAKILRAERPQKVDRGTMEDLREVASLVGRLGQTAIVKNRTPQYEFFSAFSETAYEAIRFATTSDPKMSHEVDAFVKRVIQNGVSLVAETYKNPSYEPFDDLFNLSAIWAFLMHYYQQTRREVFLDLYVEILDWLIAIDKDAVDRIGEDQHRITELYRYIKLFGAWLFRFVPTHPFNEKVVHFLAERHVQQRLQRGLTIESEMSYHGYPTDHIAHVWFIRPSEHWPDQQQPVTRELNDLNSYKSYDKEVCERAKKLGTYVEIRHRRLT